MRIPSSILILVTALLANAFADSTFAQASPADDDRLLTGSQPATGAKTPYQEIYLDDGSVIVNRGPWTPENRKEGRPDDLWRTYMHGVVDHFATPVPLGSLLSDEQKNKRLFVPRQTINTPYKTGRVDIVRAVRSDSIETTNPLPVDMELVRGKTIRVFIWMKGDDVGARNNDWHCPSMYVIIKDAEGKTLLSRDSYFKTQRTFPWHCYYVDRFVPENAAGIYLRVFNKFLGTASFAMPSYEIVTDENTYTTNEKQDPFTGSLAFNPIYDPLPYHLQRGTLNADRYQWRLVLGDKIGLIGQPYDITTRAGLSRYYFEKAKTQGDHMNHGVLYLGSLYRNGIKKNLLPPMEEGWLEHLADILIDDQDEKTGYWHDGKSLSLGLTFHLVDMHFRYKDVPRADRPDQINTGLDLGLKRIPRADKIIETSLMMQSTWTDEHGNKRLAAWNRAAYRYTEDPDKSPEKCNFASTWDAINLIRRASNYVDDATRRRVESAVREAFYYVLRFNVLDDGTFLISDRDEHPTTPYYMAGIMRDSAWLERKIDPDMTPPDVVARANHEQAVFTWRNPAENHNSVRIYVVPQGTPIDAIDEQFLTGVIHRTGQKVYEMDPFVGCQKIRHAMAKRWGSSLELPPADNWKGKRYLPWKLRKLNFPLVVSDNLEPLTLQVDQVTDKHVYVSSVTWYGEESRPVPVNLK